MERFEIDYALSKQVPAMRNGVRLCSDYGELELHGQAAAKIAAVVEGVLRDKLAQLERMQQAEREARD